MFTTFVVLCLVSTAFAQVSGFRGCPDVEPDPNFDVSKYLGKWYEAERFSINFNSSGKCGTSIYTFGESRTIKIVNSEFSKSDGNLSCTIGIARVPDASKPAKFKVKFPTVLHGIEQDYWVLGTDYDSFSVVFACTDMILIKFQFAWILTRQQNPDASVIAKADAVIAKNKLDRSSFLKTDQTNCEASKLSKL